MVVAVVPVAVVVLMVVVVTLVVRNVNTFTIHRHVSIIRVRLSSVYGAVSLHAFTYLSTASADVPLSSFPPSY